MESGEEGSSLLEASRDEFRTNVLLLILYNTGMPGIVTLNTKKMFNLNLFRRPMHIAR